MDINLNAYYADACAHKYINHLTLGPCQKLMKSTSLSSQRDFHEVLSCHAFIFE